SPLAIPLTQLGSSLGGLGAGTGKVLEQAFGAAKMTSELAWFKGREPFIESPQKKMDTYFMLLQDREQKDPPRLKAIAMETKWVLDPDSKSDGDARAKARYVQGLTLRNDEKFAEARDAFADTLKLIPDKGAKWAAHAHKSHKELIDPNE